MGSKQIIERLEKRMAELRNEAKDSLRILNERAAKRYSDVNSMYELDINYYIDIARFAWAAREKQIVLLYVQSEMNEIKRELAESEANVDGVTQWLQKRIEQTTEQKENADSLHLTIGKGGKLCAYKEVLNYIKTHGGTSEKVYTKNEVAQLFENFAKNVDKEYAFTNDFTGLSKEFVKDFIEKI